SKSIEPKKATTKYLVVAFLVLQGWYRTSIVGGLERMSSHLWRRLYWYYSSYLLDAITKLVYSSKKFIFSFFYYFCFLFSKKLKKILVN
ncbi:hypothetical protein, partial [Enterococcus faecium]|uniref:hypothetical protein n=2 Tax=Enterococcus faecium TaxID=1352 RepID=UPI001CA368F8